MILSVPPQFACLMGDTPLTVEDVLSQLQQYEGHCCNGYASAVDHMESVADIRLRLLLAAHFFGADSQQAKDALEELGREFCLASMDGEGEKWTLVLKCYELAGQSQSFWLDEACWRLKD